MERIKIGIYDRNPGYARSLAGYFRRHHGEAAEIQVFTGSEALEQAVRENRIGILLADETAENLCRASPDVKSVILSETEAIRPEEGGEAETGRSDSEAEKGGGSKPDGLELPRICRYQPADRIWKALLLLFESEFLTEHGGGNGKTEGKLIGICTPGTDSTGLGMLLTALFAERGRTLYLTLEEFSSFQTIMGAESPELSELYYYYSQNSLTTARLAASVLGNSSAQMIAPVRDPEDLYRDGMLYETKFFRTLAELGGYRQLILNLGGVSGRGSLLEACQAIIGEVESPAASWLEKHGLGGKSHFLPGTLIQEAGEIRTLEQALHAPQREKLRKYMEISGGSGFLITGSEVTDHGRDPEKASWKTGGRRSSFR